MEVEYLNYKKMNSNIFNNEELASILQNGGVVVMPTDTVYGILTKAENENSVKRLYQIRKRSPEKPCITLIGDISEIKKFSVSLSEAQESELKKYWPGPVSVILECKNDSLQYLHRGTNTLAFRLPDIKELRGLLLKTGPLIAPSANTEGSPHSENIEDAKKYFGDQVDMYLDGGSVVAKASKLIRLYPDGQVEVLRA